ncbi:hypothetical protein COLO4_01080, partial [Corchorus olitorius]
ASASEAGCACHKAMWCAAGNPVFPAVSGCASAAAVQCPAPPQAHSLRRYPRADEAASSPSSSTGLTR